MPWIRAVFFLPFILQRLSRTLQDLQGSVRVSTNTCKNLLAVYCGPVKYVTKGVSFPDDYRYLADYAKARAAEDGRSFSNWVCRLIEEHRREHEAAASGAVLHEEAPAYGTPSPVTKAARTAVQGAADRVKAAPTRKPK